MRISIVALLPAAAALALAPRTAAAQREFHWKGPVAPGKAIEIKGVNGDVRASAGSGDVEVTAVKRARKRDRKSTRLNSSHSQISYAVFCLKKKKTTNNAYKARRLGAPDSALSISVSLCN